MDLISFLSSSAHKFWSIEIAMFSQTYSLLSRKARIVKKIVLF